MSSERRRETRISGNNARFMLSHGGVEVECQVVNLSRLGLGIELPVELAASTPLTAGSRLTGKLRVGDAELTSDTVVRVVRGTFLGLEYEAPSAAFIRSLIAVLTPAYVAASIFPIAKANLGPHIEAVYHGDEFELVLFRTGLSRNGNSMQIFCGGEMVEFTQEGVRLVPSPLVRPSNAPGGYDFITEFSSYTKGGISASRIAKTLELLKQIIDLWEKCPPQIREIVHSHYEKHCRNI